MTTEAGERDFELSTVFALTMKTLLRRPVTALLLAAMTATLPAELYLRLVPYVQPAFSTSFALYTLGSFAAFSPAAVLTGWMALDVSGEDRPLTRATKRALPLIFIYFVVTTVGMVGLLAFIVPGILWSLATAVAVPAAAVERLGMKNAIIRSLDLTKDRRGMIFVISIVVMLPPVMAVGLFELAMNGWHLLSAQENLIITNVTRPITDTLVTMWGSALTAALYVDLVRVVGPPNVGGAVTAAEATR
jgi:hypothetical protein